MMYVHNSRYLRIPRNVMLIKSSQCFILLFVYFIESVQMKSFKFQKHLSFNKLNFIVKLYSVSIIFTLIHIHSKFLLRSMQRAECRTQSFCRNILQNRKYSFNLEHIICKYRCFVSINNQNKRLQFIPKFLFHVGVNLPTFSFAHAVGKNQIQGYAMLLVTFS